MTHDFKTTEDIRKALLARGASQEQLFAQARKVRDDIFQRRVEVRSVLEYTNICQQACRYCGMHRDSNVRRFVLDNDESLKRVQYIYHKGRRVLMVQTGEFDSQSYFKKLFMLLKEVKIRYRDLTVICSLGNLSEDKYKKLRDIGIERYLLKFETSDPKLYKSIKPTDTLKDRLHHIKMLKKLGFHVSSGNIVGLPGQKLTSLVNDLLLLRDLDIPMGGTSVFIPNDMSDYSHFPAGDIDVALNFTAILRIICPAMLIPTTTSLELLRKDGQYWGLMAGANLVTMHDCTPRDEQDKFVIYKKDRYKPKDILLEIIEKAGLKPSPASLMRDRTETSLFYKFVCANMKGNKTAVYSDGVVYSYRDIYSLTSQFCTFLIQNNIREGDIVLLALPDSIEFIVAFLSCIRLGIVAGLVDPRMNKEEWTEVLLDLCPKAVLATNGVREMLKDEKILKVADDDTSDYFLNLVAQQSESKMSVTPDQNNPAVILFTSGTTGRPKGVVHTCKDLRVDTFSRTILKMSEHDIVFSCSRMYTAYGLGNSLLSTFQLGAKVILSRTVPNPFSLQNILKLKPTLFFAVPAVYESLLGHRDSLRDLFRPVRLFIAAGEKLYEDVAERWEKTYGKRILDCYGSTEVCHSFISNIPGKEKLNSCGKILDGFEIKFSKSGRIFYRGSSLFSGYWRDPDLTQRKLLDGWYKSDDVGYMDRRGYIFIQGRGNLVFKLNGKWCSVLEVENSLRKYALIKEVAVVKSRQGLDYFVSTNAQIDHPAAEREIRQYCVKALSLAELPRNIHILDEIPKTRSGKINRKYLSDLAQRLNEK